MSSGRFTENEWGLAEGIEVDKDERFQREELIRQRVKNRRNRQRRDEELAIMAAYECEHCGSAFELDTKHPICGRCEAAVCYKGCSDGNCPAW